MSEQNEILSPKDRTIEVSTITDVPAEFALPKGKDRLVIGAKPQTTEEQPDGGIEVISLAEYPRDRDGIVNYKGVFIDGGPAGPVEALLIDPLVPINENEGTGYKALRKGEVVSADKLAKRFKKEAGFSIGLDKDGKVMIENGNPDRPIDVLAIQIIEKELSPEQSEELHEEAADDMGELATEQLVAEQPIVDVETGTMYPHEIKKMREEAALRAASGRVLDIPSVITSEEVKAIADLNKEVPVVVAAETAVDPNEVLRKLTEGLSDNDLLELRSYANATDEVREAQKDGRGQDSTYWQQIKGQSLRLMSERAKSVANRYAGYYRMEK